jgi:hypothetical protein
VLIEVQAGSRPYGSNLASLVHHHVMRADDAIAIVWMRSLSVPTSSQELTLQCGRQFARASRPLPSRQQPH